ncbi:MAG: PQQ-binding-like beta-propeller repeat protein [bacterium]
MKAKKLVATAAVLATIILTAVLPANATPSYAPGDWPMYNRDASGSRYNSAETVLTPATVGGLVEKWRWPTAGTYGTPVVVGNTVYAGDFGGVFYALDTATGQPRWVAGGNGPITGSALVVGDVVIFGDLLGFIHGLNKNTGLPAWPPIHPNNGPSAAVYSSPTLAGDKVVIGIASQEELLAFTPGYPCCKFRGSVVALDPTPPLGASPLLWQRYTITDAEAAAGSAGAGVWSTPTYDAESGLLYVTTGNNYSAPATLTSDATIALNANTGAIVWNNQLFPNDIWNFSIPPDPEHPDYDFADSPQVYRLVNGRKVVAAGQKSGFLHVMDATTGTLLHNLQLEPGGLFGGLFADSAQADGVTFSNGIDWPGPGGDPGGIAPPAGLGNGHLIAVRSDVPGGLHEQWRFPTPDSPNMGGVAVAGGVVYFISSRSGTLYALSADTGAVLAAVPLAPSISGPSVSNGRVYAGVGDAEGAVGGQKTDGAIVALGLP